MADAAFGAQAGILANDLGHQLVGVQTALHQQLSFAEAHQLDARIRAAGTTGQAGSAQAKGAPMRLFHLSIAYLTLLFAAVAVTALLPWGHW